MIFTGTGIVWDGENDSRLCKFTEGKFETEDKRTIDILSKLGYEEVETDFIDVEYKEVKEEEIEAIKEPKKVTHNVPKKKK